MTTWEIRENDPSESTPEPTRSGPSRVPASLPAPASIESVREHRFDDLDGDLSKYGETRLTDDEKRAAVLENARLAVEFDPIVRFNESDEAAEGRLWLKALRLSGGSLDVFEALLRGERVPVSRLDQQWRRAYGRK